MYSWVELSQTITSSGDPQQFFDKDGEVFIVAFQRVTGPSDSVMPRRVVGIGATRALARSAVRDALSAYDSSYTTLPLR